MTLSRLPLQRCGLDSSGKRKALLVLARPEPAEHTAVFKPQGASRDFGRIYFTGMGFGPLNLRLETHFWGRGCWQKGRWIWQKGRWIFESDSKTSRDFFIDNFTTKITVLGSIVFWRFSKFQKIFKFSSFSNFKLIHKVAPRRAISKSTAPLSEVVQSKKFDISFCASVSHSRFRTWRRFSIWHKKGTDVPGKNR